MMFRVSPTLMPTVIQDSKATMLRKIFEYSLVQPYTGKAKNSLINAWQR